MSHRRRAKDVAPEARWQRRTGGAPRMSNRWRPVGQEGTVADTVIRHEYLRRMSQRDQEGQNGDK